MALFRKLFYRKPPDGLLEICEQVYVFDCCFTTHAWEEKNYQVYIGGVVSQLRDHFPDASFLVFNFREGEKQSLLTDVLSDYDMTIMDYPRHYEGCPLLTMEVVHHFLRSCESWLSLGLNNLLLMHCERGGWPVLAFMLAALLIYRKQYSGEQKTLDMVYRQAPRDLLHLLSPLNPIPSQLRYLQYVSRRNVVSEWPPLDRALTLDCVILRSIPDFDGEGGCRPIFRIYGQDPFLTTDRTPKVLYSTPRRGRSVRVYKQAECELVKIDINCHIQGDIVVDCLNLNDNMEQEVMMFRAVFNTAFIRSNILMLNRDEIDTLWDAREAFPRNFRAELLFSEMDAASAVVAVDFSCLEEKDGLPMEAFAKVHEIFSHVDWLDNRADVALNMLQHLNVSNIVQEELDADSQTASPRPRVRSPRKIQDVVKHKAMDNSAKISMSLGLKVESVASPKTSPDTDVRKKGKPQGLHISFQQPLQSDIIGQQTPQSAPVHSTSLEDSSLLVSQHDGAPQQHHVKPLSHDHGSFQGPEFSHLEKAPPAVSSGNLSVAPKMASASQTYSPAPPAQPSFTSSGTEIPPPSAPPLPTPSDQASKSSKSLLIKKTKTCSQDRNQLLLNRPALPLESPSLATTSYTLLSIPSASPTSRTTSTPLPPPPPTPPPPTFTPSPSPPLDGKLAVQGPPPPPPPPLCSGQTASPSMSSQVPPPPTVPALSSNLSQVPSSPTLPPTPSSKGPTVRNGPPAPPPPPVQSGKSAGFTTSSLVPPPPPPAPTLSLSSSAVPSAPPPPVPFGQGAPKSVSHSPEPPSATSNTPPSPAPPFGSPSSAKGRVLRSVNSKSYQSKKLKPLHWLKLTRAVQGSLWAEAQKSGEASKAPEIDMSELESLFSASAPNSDQGRKSSLQGSRGPKSDKVQLIDHRRAYNCEIMLSKVKVPLHDLMSSVLALEDSALDVDQVDNLIKFCPTKEEMELLKGYTGEKEKLGKCELFFLELMKVPRVEIKLRVFSFKIQFCSQVSDLRNSLNVVNSAAEEIRNCVKLKKIMQTILSLGNALNQGTARGSAIGFRLDSLLKLSETRALNNKMTLMHYLCKVLAGKLPELLDFSKDLSSLEPASRIQLKFLAEEMQAINKGLEKVVQELSMSENDGLVSENFRKTLKEFLCFAEAEVRSLASLYSGVGRNVDALILYFGEDPARCTFEQVVSTLLNFVRMFTRAHDENSKQLELQMKKSTENEKSKINASHKESEHILNTSVRSSIK